VPIRPWEFLNYYTFDYPAADPGELRVELDLVEGATAGEYLLQVGVVSAPATREPMNLALVIDDSCSMDGGPLRTAGDVGRAIASSLREDDVVSLVTWSDDQDVLLEAHTVSGPDDAAILGALDGLASGGSTNLSAGLATGYRLLDEHFSDDRVNRLVLISDGGANVGVTDEDLIGRRAGREDEGGIYLVGVGVGTATTYQDLLMDVVTDLGKGASVFVPDAAEAERMFGERYASTVGVAARDVQIRLDLPPGFSVVRTSAEEISTDPEEVRPQHVSPGDAVVLHQTLASSCVDPDEALPIGVTVTWLDAVTFDPREASASATLGELLARDHRLLRKGAAVVACADALRAARDGDGDEEVALALDALDAARALAGDDPDLDELDEVLAEL
jgi:Ca-activated chloride channel family protein